MYGQKDSLNFFVNAWIKKEFILSLDEIIVLIIEKKLYFIH